MVRVVSRQRCHASLHGVPCVRARVRVSCVSCLKGGVELGLDGLAGVGLVGKGLLLLGRRIDHHQPGLGAATREPQHRMKGKRG